VTPEATALGRWLTRHFPPRPPRGPVDDAVPAPPGTMGRGERTVLATFFALWLLLLAGQWLFAAGLGFGWWLALLLPTAFLLLHLLGLSAIGLATVLAKLRPGRSRAWWTSQLCFAALTGWAVWQWRSPYFPGMLAWSWLVLTALNWLAAIAERPR
jgi:hypothetical protein